MLIRIVTVVFLGLASASCLAQATLKKHAGPSQVFLGPLGGERHEAAFSGGGQIPIDWPPKSVPKQQKGKVPDFKAKNDLCLDCHKDIMEVKTSRNNIPNPHRLHLESKKIAYEGKNRDCLTCHEMVVPSETKAKKKEGWFVKGDVYHPNVLQEPKGVWKKLIVRPGEGESYAVGALRPSDPNLYKPSLKRLVCAECHGPDSKVKTFYGAPQAAK